MKFNKLATVILSTTLTLATSNALADQCQAIPVKQAKKAMTLILNAKSSVQTLCEPCGEKTAQRLTVQSLEVKKTILKGLWEVRANQKALDIAYVYVDGKNLGQLVGCTPEGVSLTLE